LPRVDAICKSLMAELSVSVWLSGDALVCTNAGPG